MRRPAEAPPAAPKAGEAHGAAPISAAALARDGAAHLQPKRFRLRKAASSPTTAVTTSRSTASSSAFSSSSSTTTTTTTSAAAASFDDGGEAAPGEKADTRPNVLLLMTDSFDGRLLDPRASLYAAVELPHLRGLAARATNFVRAYTPSPVCVPGRAAMLTGRRPDQIRVWSNSDGLAAAPGGGVDPRCIALYGDAYCERLAAQQRAELGGGVHGHGGGRLSLLDDLRHAGYSVGAYGKLDTGAFYANNTGTHNWEWNGFHENPKEHWCTLARSADVQLRQTVAPKVSSLPREEQEDYLRDDETMRHCKATLDAFTRPGRRRRAWALYCNLDYPHGAYYPAEDHRYLRAVNRTAAALPEALAAPSSHPFHAAMSLARGMRGHEAGGGGGGGGGIDGTRLLSFRVAYLAKCAQVDAWVGELLAQLAASAAHAPKTLVLFTADHGEMAAEHALVQKASLLEAAARVPLVLAGARVPAAAQRLRTIVSLLDVRPTLLDAIGEKADPSMAGRSLLSLARRGGAAADDDDADDGAVAVSQYHGATAATGSFMLVSGRHKLLTYGRTYEHFGAWRDQVFDLAADPHETRDLAQAQPALAATLRSRLARQVDVQAVDRRAMAAQFVVFRLQEGACWRHTRRCFGPELRRRDKRRLRAWEDEGQARFAAELRAAQLPNGTDLLAGQGSTPSCKLPPLPHCEPLTPTALSEAAAAAGMELLRGLDLPGHDRPCVEASADGRYCCCTVCAADGAAACARNRAWCSAIAYNRERTFATLKGGLHPARVRAALVRGASQSQSVMAWRAAGGT